MRQWHNDLAHRLPLAGEWAFALGDQQGVIHLPGCWEAQGYPRRTEGPAIFRRTVDVPAEWAGRVIQLQADAVSYSVEVEVNGQPVGTHRGAWSPFALDVTEAIIPGQANELTLRVIKPGERFPIREALAGFLPDVMLMFGGVWQDIRLVAHDGPALSGLTVRAEASGALEVAAEVHGPADGQAQVRVWDPSGVLVLESPAPRSGDRVMAALHVPGPELWGPGQPRLYTLELALPGADGTAARLRRCFGFRALTAENGQVHFNGVPTILRGVLNWGWYPETLCPAPDEATIRDEFRRVREMGFNLVKLCLVVPSPSYFEIADEEGMLLWLELPLWLPRLTPEVREQAVTEYAEIMAAVHHHPSIVIYSLGCELDASADADFLARLDAAVRGQSCGTLYCDNSGSGEAYGGLDVDFADFNDYHFYCDLQYFGPLVDHFRRDWRPARPWIFGEFCDADDYRDLGAIAAAHGGALPWWHTEWNPLHPQTFVGYPAQGERMAGLDLELSDPDLARLSHRQSLAVRKNILEKVRARGMMGGYVVTGLRDTPLATSAVFDDLGRAKYPVEAFRAFNADSVLTLQRGRARRWTGGDRPAPFDPYCFAAGAPLVYEVALTHAGPALPAGTLTWTLNDADGACAASGEVQVPELDPPDGQPKLIGQIRATAPATGQAARLQLNVEYQPDGGQAIVNSWGVWVFPAVTAWPSGIACYDPGGRLAGLDDLLDHAPSQAALDPAAPVMITSTLDAAMVRYLNGGGRVLLLQEGDRPLPVCELPFWREAIKLIGDHPVLRAFPHEGFVDMQFYCLATDRAFDSARLAEALPGLGAIMPLLRRLDARQFFLTEYLFEARVGAGRLIASTLRFRGGLGDQPVGLRASPAARWLLYLLLESLARF